MVRETRPNDLFRPLTIVAVVAAIMLFAGGLIMSDKVDEVARAREQSLVANGIAGKIIEVNKSLSPLAISDDTLFHLQRKDKQWARRNAGQFLYDVQGFEYSFILDHKNNLFFAAKDGQPIPLPSYHAFARPMHQAVADVRKQEALHAAKTGSGVFLGDPIQVHNVIRVNGVVYIAVASLVQPDFGTVKALHKTAPVIIAAKPMDENFLYQFGQRYLRPDLKLRQVQIDDMPGVAQVDINNDLGKYVATFFWYSGKPGTELAKTLLLPAVLVVTLFTVMIFLMQRRSWRAAQELIASEARASHLAYHDPLTGLPNRVLFFDRLGVALDHVRRNNGSIAVHCLDLDRFKEVNDTYGHQMGDELICAVARRVSEVCRRSDTFARLSGDEFAIVQLDATPMAASRLAERIIEAFAKPIELSGGRVHASCSIGVNIIMEGGASAAEALRHADLALYRSKHNGRGQYCFFEPEMDAAMRMRREMEVDLREALANGDLRMVYQPQADKNGRIIGVEALLRWHHPERGDVPPSMFVQIAEECGLISEIGLFTLRESFKASHKWQGLKVAINISASQLRMRDFHQRVKELLKECNVNASDFELEITEGLLLGDDPVTHDTLMKLRQMGFSIALDDFGTGYSSLSYLQRYPIDKIKIDRSFIANLGVEWESRAVVQAIVKLARALNLHVVAEGVETDEQRNYLLDVGCEEIQGFLYSKPVDADQVTQFYSAEAHS